jgi:hypothetical protein
MMDMPVFAKFKTALLVLSTTGSGSTAGPGLKLNTSLIPNLPSWFEIGL